VSLISYSLTPPHTHTAAPKDLESDNSFVAVANNFTRRGLKKAKKRSLARKASVIQVPRSSFGDCDDEEQHLEYVGYIAQYMDHPNIVAKACTEIDSWSFDVFKVHKASNGNSLSVVGMASMLRNNLMDVTPPIMFVEFLAEITKRYRDNPYHNSIHGADVCQSMHSIMISGRPFMKRLSHPVRYGALIAALCHDVGHPGRNNAFLTKASSIGKPLLLPLPLMSLSSDKSQALASIATDIASIYNDRSPLEQMHVTVMRNLARQKECDIFSMISREEQSTVLRLMTEMILGTDMVNHNDNIAALVRYADTSKKVVKDDHKGGTPQACVDVLPALLHCADVCNPTKPWSLYKRWTDRIMQEFFDQGDDEQMLDVDVMFDKEKIDIPNFQLYFIGGFIRGYFKILDKISDFNCKEIMDNMDANESRWKEIAGKKKRSDSSSSSSS